MNLLTCGLFCFAIACGLLHDWHRRRGADHLAVASITVSLFASLGAVLTGWVL